ncbi:MAG: response regulator [Patescibacteria group bacterium]|nr:response regulator [Patescibacteria group bacterium]MDD4610828.1 response regulator [Patescibacteria group bacterium]
MRKKVFIIEDDANILYALQAKLSLEGFEVEINNGSEAVENALYEIKEFKPNYIILDLILPKIDGFKMAKALREDLETSAIPVFIFTSLSDNDSRSMGANLGVKYYFIKNELSIDDFIYRFKKVINNKEKIAI